MVHFAKRVTGCRQLGQFRLRKSQVVKQSRQKTCPHGVVVGRRPIHLSWQMAQWRLAAGLRFHKIKFDLEKLVIVAGV